MLTLKAKYSTPLPSSTLLILLLGNLAYFSIAQVYCPYCAGKPGSVSIEGFNYGDTQYKREAPHNPWGGGKGRGAYKGEKSSLKGRAMELAIRAGTNFKDLEEEHPVPQPHRGGGGGGGGGDLLGLGLVNVKKDLASLDSDLDELDKDVLNPLGGVVVGGGAKSTLKKVLRFKGSDHGEQDPELGKSAGPGFKSTGGYEENRRRGGRISSSSWMTGGGEEIKEESGGKVHVGSRVGSSIVTQANVGSNNSTINNTKTSERSSGNNTTITTNPAPMTVIGSNVTAAGSNATAALNGTASNGTSGGEIPLVTTTPSSAPVPTTPGPSSAANPPPSPETPAPSATPSVSGPENNANLASSPGNSTASPNPDTAPADNSTQPAAPPSPPGPKPTSEFAEFMEPIGKILR